MAAGVVSMGRYDDPNSGKSSFSFLLGAAPHLDMHYTIFG
jgi:cyclophilin family peptidyl-prolyl cis-trans isomerase